MEIAHLVLLANFASTAAMAGLIWFVQIVHYPLFDGVAKDAFATYEARHARRTTWVVMPLMVLELGTAGWLVLQPPGEGLLAPAAVGLAMVFLIWASTFFIQVPLHGRLAAGFGAAAHARLVLTNWIRTFLWTARTLLVAWMILQLLRLG